MARAASLSRSEVGRVDNKTAKALLKEYKGLIHLWVRKMWPHKRKAYHIDKEDMEMVAQTALVEAYATFAPERNVTRITWYSLIIKHRLINYAAELQDLSRAELAAQMKSRKNRRTLEAYAKKHGLRVEDVDPEVAGTVPLTDFDKARIQDANMRSLHSLDQTLSTEQEDCRQPGNLYNFIATNPHEFENELEYQERRMWLALASEEWLTQRERVALESWMQDRTNHESAADHDITRQRFSVIRGEALWKLYFAFTGVCLDEENSIEGYLRQIDLRTRGLWKKAAKEDAPVGVACVVEVIAMPEPLQPKKAPAAYDSSRIPEYRLEDFPPPLSPRKPASFAAVQSLALP